MTDAKIPTDSKIPRGVIVAVSLGTVAVALWGLWRAWSLHQDMIQDERQVYGQVRLFLLGRFELFHWPNGAYPAAAMFPGYQVVLAGVSAVVGESTQFMLRLYTFGFSLVYLVVIYGVGRQFFPHRLALLRAMQSYVLPILFPYHFLLYTDEFSMLVTMAAFWAVLREKWNLSGILAVIALGVRQTNVVFVVFLWGFTLVANMDGARPALKFGIIWGAAG